jgi:glutathione S-transferase
MAKKPLLIYGRILSPYVARVALAARAKGLAYEIKMPDGSIKGEAYLKINPLGRVPALKDGTSTLFESGVIIDYLDATSRAKKLLPSAAHKAGAIRLVGAVAGEYVQLPAIDLFRLKRGTTIAPVDLEATTAAMRKGLAALEKVLVRGPYAGGARFSRADCYVVPALLFATGVTQAFGMGDVLENHPKLRKYWAGIRKHKTAKPIIADMTAMMDDALSGRLPPLH